MSSAPGSVETREAHSANIPPNKLVYPALTAAAFFWGAGFSAVRFALRTVSPVELLAGTAVFGGLAQIAWTTMRGNWRALRLSPALFWVMVALGLFSQNILNGLTNLGLASTTATNAALIYGFSPVVIGLLAALTLREPFGTGKRVGAVAGFVGVALIITQGHPETIQLHGVMFGNLWLLGAAIYWAGYSVATRSLTQRMPAEAFTFYVIVLGAVLPVGWVWAKKIASAWRVSIALRFSPWLLSEYAPQRWPRISGAGVWRTSKRAGWACFHTSNWFLLLPSP